MLSLKQIYGRTQDLIAKNPEAIIENYLQKGGWEGWAQVELERKYKTLPGLEWVLREQNIYEEKREAVDFLISSDSGLFCIELKCESLFQSAEDGRVTKDHKFYEKVITDIRKFDRRLEEFQAATACVIAITVSEEAAAGVAEQIRGIECDEFPHDSEETGRWIIRLFLYPVG